MTRIPRIGLGAGEAMVSERYPLIYVAGSLRQVVEHYHDRLTALVREGFDVHVVAPDDGGGDALGDVGVRVRGVPGGSGWNPAGFVGAYLILQGHLIEERPVLVHGFGWPWAWLAAFAASQVDAAMVATVPEHRLAAREWVPDVPLLRRMIPVLRRTPPGGSGPARLYEWLGESVDSYLCTTSHDLELLEGGGLVPGPRLDLVVGGRGVDLLRFDARSDEIPPQSEARERVGIPSHVRHVVGVVCDETAGIDADVVGRAMRGVQNIHPSLGWFLVGTRATELVEDLPRFVGRKVAIHVTDDAARPIHYRAMDLHVRPAHRDPWSVPTKQAAAMEIPTVAFDVPSARDAVIDHDTGRLVSRADVSGLVDAVNALVHHPADARNYGRRARGRAETRFDRRKIDDQVLRIYDRILRTRLG